jgi:hypothetical protein
MGGRKFVLLQVLSSRVGPKKSKWQWSRLFCRWWRWRRRHRHGFGGQQSHFHKGESFSCRISDAEQFDEAKFIQVLKESVEKDLETSGAKVVSSKNPDATSFTIEYAQGNTTGRINISGRRNPGNNCHFDADLDEKTGAK